MKEIQKQRIARCSEGICGRARQLRYTGAVATAAILGTFACGVATARAQINGNATITGSAFGQPLTVGTSSQFAGAVSSIRWGGKEFINNWDHGRQFQANPQLFDRYECYNPYESGTKEDAGGPTSSSRLLSLTASGNTLVSSTQMAWYLSTRETREGFGDLCGDPKDWLPVPPYTGPLSDYRMHKTVRIGFAGMPNVIEFQAETYYPESVRKGLNQVTAVTPYEFSSIRSYDIISKDYRTLKLESGEDDAVKVISTPDGAHAMGFYSPDVLEPYGQTESGYRWRTVFPDPLYRDPNNPSLLDPDYPCIQIGSIYRYDSFNGPGIFYDRGYLVMGNVEQVRTTLASLHFHFRALDPDIFNWQEYVRINGLAAALPDHKAAQNHWLTNGIKEGRAGSKTFSPSQYLQLNADVAGFYGVENYQGAIDHYIAVGRAEGRSTVAKPASAMQHLIVFANDGVRASGANFHGQLADPDPSAISAPQRIMGLNAVTEVAAGDYTSFAVKSDGTLWMWGSNRYGARGDGSSGEEDITTPVQVPIPARISTPGRGGKHAVAVGAGVYAAIDVEGHVWTWGVNWNGRLGDGTTTTRYTPARVRKNAQSDEYLTDVISVVAGGGTLVALDADATVWTWGAGANGALGNGSTQDSPYPVQVINDQGTPLVGISQVASGSSGFCVALVRYGAVFGWGSNAFSQLGIEGGGALSVATHIPVPGRVEGIAAGSSHVIARSNDGNVYGWGYNGRGQLANGSTAVAQAAPVAMQTRPAGMNNIDDLVAGANFSVMVRNSDRAVFVAGDNQSGQLGIPGNAPVQPLAVRSSF